MLLGSEPIRPQRRHREPLHPLLLQHCACRTEHRHHRTEHLAKGVLPLTRDWPIAQHSNEATERRGKAVWGAAANRMTLISSEFFNTAASVRLAYCYLGGHEASAWMHGGRPGAALLQAESILAAIAPRVQRTAARITTHSPQRTCIAGGEVMFVTDTEM